MKDKRIIKTLEGLCPFCGEPNNQAIIALGEKEKFEGKEKAITLVPCAKCGKFLDEGDVGFIVTKTGESVIFKKEVGKAVLKFFEKLNLYKENGRNIFRVPSKFWAVKKDKAGSKPKPA